MSIRIAQYQHQHLQQVREFILQAHREFGFEFDAKLDSDLDNPEEYYFGTGGNFWILLDSERVIGTVAIKKLGTLEAELKRLYVHPAWRRQGWGSHLLTVALAFAEKNKFKLLSLDTDSRQHAAHALYKRHGFQVVKMHARTIYMSKTF